VGILKGSYLALGWFSALLVTPCITPGGSLLTKVRRNILLNNSLIRKISKLKYGLDLGFISFYSSFEKQLKLRPERWRLIRDLQYEFICKLERLQVEDHTSFILAVNKIQRHYKRCFFMEKNVPILLDNYKKSKSYDNIGGLKCQKK